MLLPLADTISSSPRKLSLGLAAVPRLSQRLLLIENGVDLGELDDVADAPEPVRTWRREEDFVIGYTGRLDPGKRIDTVLRAFARLTLTRKRLCIVGEGPEHRRLEQLARDLGVIDKVAFLSFRGGRSLGACALILDVFVLASEREGILVCLMEAMGLGIAVVVSDIPGCRNLVSDGVSGLLFSPGDDAALAEACGDTSPRQPSLLKRPCDRGEKAHPAKHYSAQTMANQYECAVSQITNTKRAPWSPGPPLMNEQELAGPETGFYRFFLR